MKKSIIEDLDGIISKVSYGDITRNDLDTALESLKESINEHLIEGNE